MNNPPTTVATEARLIRAAGLLRAAADRIARCGLYQGEYWPITVGQHTYIEGDPCCALGALAVAADIDDPYRADGALNSHPELVIAMDTLADQIDPDNIEFGVVSSWNDHSLRTAGEVTAALRAAAAQLNPDPPDPPPPPTDTDSSDHTHSSAVCSTSRPGGPSATSLHRAGISSTRQHSTSEVIGNV